MKTISCSINRGLGLGRLTLTSLALTSVVLASLMLSHSVVANESAQQSAKNLTTIADARKHPAVYVDVGVKGDSVGDMWVFDQPLLDQKMRPIGNNSGFCIRTKLGHSSQCQWTLTVRDGSIQVAGRETEKGSSAIAIVGGTGKYKGITGQMISTNNENGTFTQVLSY